MKKKEKSQINPGEDIYNKCRSQRIRVPHIQKASTSQYRKP